jgi:hypothetical protein
MTIEKERKEGRKERVNVEGGTEKDKRGEGRRAKTDETT